MPHRTDRRPLLAAGLALGVGLGDFVDGILFHQILQWHGMVTHQYPKTGVDPETAVRNFQINMFWDGMFHVFTWAMTALGLGLLWRAVRKAEVPLSTPVLVGSMLLGWGLFNLVEGVIDHHILHVHHVREDLGVSVWDYAFLGSGVVLALAGWMVVRLSGAEPVRGEAQPSFRYS